MSSEPTAAASSKSDRVDRHAFRGVEETCGGGPKVRPIVHDLCCGSGGWAAGFLDEGWEVHGYDIEDRPEYPGIFHRCDVRLMLGDPRADLYVASPPCEEFSRHQMPWTRARNPPQPDISIVLACQRIAREAGRPLVLENVRMAQQWIGHAAWHCGSFYLWGDVPALMPAVIHRKKENYSSTERLRRARVPFDLAQWIARVYKPVAVR